LARGPLEVVLRFGHDASFAAFGAPYIEKLRGNRQFSAALSAITAAVVGVVLNLAVWFSLHTLLATVATEDYDGIGLLIPEVATISWLSTGVAAVACVMTFYLKRRMVLTLTTCCALGVLFFFASRLSTSHGVKMTPVSRDDKKAIEPFIGGIRSMPLRLTAAVKRLTTILPCR
jgi:chromate transporter